MPRIDIGIPETQRQEIAQGLIRGRLDRGDNFPLAPPKSSAKSPL